MGQTLFGGKAADDDEEEEQAELNAWRPAADQQQHQLVRRKKLSSKSSESSDDHSGSQVSEDASSVSVVSDEASSEGDQKSEDGSGKSSSKDDASEAESEAEIAEEEKKRDARKKKKIVVSMYFEPLLDLHQALGTIVEEPKDLFAHGKHMKKHQRMEQAAIEDAQATNRAKAKATAEWMTDMNLEDCVLTELAQVLGEDPDELRYALVQSGRFEVDPDGHVTRTVLQKIFDVMESDIETLAEVLEKLADEAEEAQVRESIKASQGELRIKEANDIVLIEHVDLAEEANRAKEDDKEKRQKEKDDKRKQKQRRGKKNIEEEEESSSDDEEEEGGFAAANREAERKALAFRRVQVQRKIEEFLKLYTKGQNLTKINAKGKRYHRRVYVDTSKKSLVVQGASGPKFFLFQNMKEVDIDTRTTKEGRVETLVICAIEKGGRIVKELNLAFPDPAKANTFVNCVTLFALALRNSAEQAKEKKK